MRLAFLAAQGRLERKLTSEERKEIVKEHGPYWNAPHDEARQWYEDRAVGSQMVLRGERMQRKSIWWQI